MGKVTFTASIEFENEAEVHLATELVKAIQQITSNFTTTVVDRPRTPPTGHSAGAQHGTQSPSSPEATAKVERSAPQEQPAAPHSPPRPVEELSILSVVRRLGSQEGRNDAVLDLQRYLDRKGDEGFKDFFDTYIGVIFHADVAMRPSSPEPYLEAILSLSDRWMDAIRKQITPKMLKFLTVKRPLTHPREDLFAYADAFAILVKHKVVAATGAVKTMAMLLGNPENRLAAVLMLAQTAERCGDLPATADTLDLQAAFLQVHEAVLRADILRVSRAFGWLPGVNDSMRVPPRLSEAAPPSRGFQVEAEASHAGHDGAVFSLTTDESLGTVISTARDGKVVVRDVEGKEEQELKLERHYACSSDLSFGRSMLYLCGVGREGGAAPCIAVCSRTLQDGAWRWRLAGEVPRSEMKIVTCVKAIAPEHFVTGEQLSSASAALQSSGVTRECICIYDAAHSVSNLKAAGPVVVYREHAEIVTCLAPHPTQRSCFFSGSKDQTIRCWDPRVPDRSVAVIGGSQALAGSRHHSGMITCIDSCGNHVISAGLDHQILLWDVRQLGGKPQGAYPNQQFQPCGQVPLDQQAILKLSAVEVSDGAGSSLFVAVSSVKGLFVLRVADARLVKADLAGGRQAFNPYHDVKWTSNGLWAAGEDKTVDVFRVVPE